MSSNREVEQISFSLGSLKGKREKASQSIRPDETITWPHILS